MAAFLPICKTDSPDPFHGKISKEMSFFSLAWGFRRGERKRATPAAGRKAVASSPALSRSHFRWVSQSGNKTSYRTPRFGRSRALEVKRPAICNTLESQNSVRRFSEFLRVTGGEGNRTTRTACCGAKLWWAKQSIVSPTPPQEPGNPELQTVARDGYEESYEDH
jgi:hypothetical protein